MPNNQLFAPTITGAEIPQALDTLLSAMNPDDSLAVSLSLAIPGLNASWTATVKQTPSDQRFKQLLKLVRDFDYVPVQKVEATFRASNKHMAATLTDQDGLVSAMSFRDFSVDENGQRFLAALRKAFQLQSKTALANSRLPGEYQQQIRTYQKSINDFSAQTARLGTVLSDLVRTNQTEYEALFKQLRAEHLKLVEEQNASYEEQQDALQEKVAAHEARVQEFETRESKYVRRQLHSEMLKALEERVQFRVSDGTVSKRIAITRSCLAIALLGLTLVGVGATFAWLQHPNAYLQSAPIVAGTAIMVTTAVYYIKWSDIWFRRHADAEFRAAQFKDDVLRASWIAELLFEWQAEKDAAFPELLIERFSTRLFSSDRSVGPDHPSEALTNLLKDAKSLKLGRNALEVVKSD